MSYSGYLRRRNAASTCEFAGSRRATNLYCSADSLRKPRTSYAFPKALYTTPDREAHPALEMSILARAVQRPAATVDKPAIEELAVSGIGFGCVPRTASNFRLFFWHGFGSRRF